MGLEVVATLSNDQGRKSRARNNVPSEIIASNNLKELNQITTTTGDLPCRDSKSITGCTAFCQSNDRRSNDFE